MDAIELRPLSLGELLDRTFTLYRNNFWLFVGIMAVPSAFSVPFSVMWYSMRGSFIFGGKPSPAIAAGAILFGLVFLLLFWIVYAMGIGAATYAVSETYLGRPSTVRGCYGKVRGKFWQIMGVVGAVWLRIFGLLILVAIAMAIVIAVLIGLMTALARGQSRTAVGIIVGVVVVLTYLGGIGLWLFWSFRYAVSIPALLLESLGVTSAIRRSVQLTQGRRGQLLLAIVLCVVIAYVGVIVFQGPFLVTMIFAARSGQLPEWLSFSSAISGAIGGAVTGPVLMIVLVICYYDTRIRKEAFDLQFMMSALDGPTPAAGTASPA